MPCPHFDVKIIQRSKRQSAVASAAYQSGERLFSEYDQKQKYYSHKSEIVHTEIMLPPHAPPEYADRNTFNFCPTRWRSSLSSRMISGLNYLSIGRPQIFTSCMMTGRLGIVPSFSMLARYLVSMFTFSAKSFRARFFAFRASFTSAPKVSKPGQSFTFAIQHHPHTFYIS